MNTCTSLTTYSNLTGCAIGIINSIIPVLLALTVLWIIWSTFNLVKSDGDSRKEWRDAILYGIIGLFIMVSIYGLVNILTVTFQFGGSTGITAPNIGNVIQSNLGSRSSGSSNTIVPVPTQTTQTTTSNPLPVSNGSNTSNTSSGSGGFSPGGGSSGGGGAGGQY